MITPEIVPEVDSKTKPKTRKPRTDEEREYHRKNQLQYYHEKKMMTVCDICGRKVTEKVLIRHQKSAACRRVAAGSEVTFKDRVDQLELLFGMLGLKEADSLIDAVLDGTTPVQTCSDISALD